MRETLSMLKERDIRAAKSFSDMSPVTLTSTSNHYNASNLLESTIN